MSEQALPLGHVQALPLRNSPPISQQPSAPYSSPWSRFVSWVCAGLLVTTFGYILWTSVATPKLQQVEEPGRALDLMVGRMLDAHDGLKRSPGWQQWIAAWTMGSMDETYVQAIEWYRELVTTTHDPGSRLRLAILLGESGRGTAALNEARQWPNHELVFKQLIEAAYDTQALSQTREAELQTSLVAAIPNGWFSNHLSARLALRANDQTRLSMTVRQAITTGEQLQQRIRPLLLFELICLVTGAIMLLGMVRMRRQRTDLIRIHSPGVPPPWSGRIAAAVLLRGGVLWVLITVTVFYSAAFEQTAAPALAIPLAYLPLLILAYVHVLKPAGLTFANSFGLRLTRDTLGRMGGIVLAVIAAGVWGEWVIGQVAEYLHLSNHWTEWFDQNLVWASPSIMTMSVLEYVLFAPVFEELVFRGLLFAMLRRRFTFLPAALISASIFALAHGYSELGFMSVFWSGFLWAWIYERTGSVIPGMVAHAMNNLLVCLTVMALLR